MTEIYKQLLEDDAIGPILKTSHADNFSPLEQDAFERLKDHPKGKEKYYSGKRADLYLLADATGLDIIHVGWMIGNIQAIEEARGYIMTARKFPRTHPSWSGR